MQDTKPEPKRKKQNVEHSTSFRTHPTQFIKHPVKRRKQSDAPR